VVAVSQIFDRVKSVASKYQKTGQGP